MSRPTNSLPYRTAFGLEIPAQDYRRVRLEPGQQASLDTRGGFPIAGPREANLPGAVGQSARLLASIGLGTSKLDIICSQDWDSPEQRVFVGTPEQGALLQPLGMLTIGRSLDNDLALPDAGVSRHHMQLMWGKDGLQLSDNASLNGTEAVVAPKRTIETDHQLTLRHGVAERVLHGEDRHVAEPSVGVFAVLDGAGGEAGGGRAAEMARQLVQQAALSGPDARESWLQDTIDAASQAIERDPDAGITTAVACRIMDQGSERKCSWVSVGDSRLYLLREETLQLLTEDEGQGSKIWNYVGKPTDGTVVLQKGCLTLRPGDRLLLASDGLTGDFEHDRLDIRVMERILREHPDPAIAAQTLIEHALKHDDRTAMVVDID